MFPQAPARQPQDVPRPAAGRLRPAAPAASEAGFGVRTRRSKAERKSSGKLTTCRPFPNRPSHPSPASGGGLGRAVWSADFKGQFRTGDGRYCYPLTVLDGFSRYLLLCRGLLTTVTEEVRPWFVRAFRLYGLPLAIRTDNGPPFASVALGGLSALSLWWVKLGILPERICPGHPEQNGRHERMHLTLKQHSTRPVRASLRAQQHAFDRFLGEYNHERPHQALDHRTPEEIYRPSARLYPERD